MVEQPESSVPEENLQEIGEIESFFSKIGVAAIELSADLKVGDTILIKGHTTSFEQKIDSMQIDRNPVEEAHAGDGIGIKVIDKVRAGDKVYKRA